MASRYFGDPVHQQTHRGYKISVWQVKEGIHYAEIDNGMGSSDAAEGTFRDVESAVVKCIAMIDSRYEESDGAAE